MGTTQGGKFAICQIFQNLSVVLREDKHAHKVLRLFGGIITGRITTMHLFPCMLNLAFVWKFFYENPRYDYSRKALSIACATVAGSKNLAKTNTKMYDNLKTRFIWLQTTELTSEIIKESTKMLVDGYLYTKNKGTGQNTCATTNFLIFIYRLISEHQGRFVQRVVYYVRNKRQLGIPVSRVYKWFLLRETRTRSTRPDFP
jgi:hypothetical protein